LTRFVPPKIGIPLGGGRRGVGEVAGEVAGGAGGEAGGGGVEGVEGADEDQAFRDRAGDSGAVPEVAQAGVGLAGDYAGDLGVADALDLAE
jgi:hypothetical protein